jgi:hypothetical protein
MFNGKGAKETKMPEKGYSRYDVIDTKEGGEFSHKDRKI